jgi:hypothetical protein
MALDFPDRVTSHLAARQNSAIEPVRHRAERINFAAWHTTPSIAHSTFKVTGDQVGAAARPSELE